MQNNLKIIIQFNIQGLRQKLSDFIQLANHLKIYIVLINETHLNVKNKFNLPNFITLRTDRPISGRINCGGTAIYIRRNITHQPVQITKTSIENSIIHIQFNEHDLRLGAKYKSPGSHLLSTDLDQ